MLFLNCLTHPKWVRDENTPEWVQHIAFEVADREALIAAKEELEAKGLDVLGVTNHGIIHSIYFFDPNGHRLELTYRSGTPEQMKQLADVAPLMLEEWSKTKKAPKHAAWLHEEN
ncbi:VOC family protein [Marinomonas sp. GJ51-6]|uniref:VOC family protein n=1 Tax=Marinomonas sp. GJ51-6 TaxID=2992802 RepID=UPI00293429C6|nr:VOC family protein [Marinomonas sp. GJ51-6]WOD08851.1 VOC family protein [Marinomonas sp. GJ51-6]